MSILLLYVLIKMLWTICNSMFVIMVSRAEESPVVFECLIQYLDDMFQPSPGTFSFVEWISIIFIQGAQNSDDWEVAVSHTIAIGYQWIRVEYIVFSVKQPR